MGSALLGMVLFLLVVSAPTMVANLFCADRVLLDEEGRTRGAQ